MADFSDWVDDGRREPLPGDDLTRDREVDDLTHYMEATSRMRERAKAAEAEVDQLRNERRELRVGLDNLVAACSSMPDAGLSEGDPRYAWWWEVASPAVRRARALLGR